MSNDRRSRRSHASGGAQPKQAPIAGLLMLRSDGSNYDAAFKALKDHCMSNFGPVATFLETGQRYSRPKPTPASVLREFRTASGWTDRDRKRILLTRLSESDRQDEKDRESLQKMFGLFLQLLEDDGRDRVENHEDWNSAYINFDAFLLGNIIHTVHTARIYSGISEREARSTAMDKFRQCRQLQDSLTKYKDNIKARVKVLQALNHPNLPSELEVASHCLNNLDPER
jgi:hypothetical protein